MWYLIVSTPDLCTLTYFSHSNSFWRSSWRIWQSSSDRISLYTTQSSAKNLEQNLTLAGRLLIKTRKSIGPSTLPWGTPLLMCIDSDTTPSTVTLGSVGKECSNPVQGLSSDAVVIQFLKETFMMNTIKCLAEIQYG